MCNCGIISDHLVLLLHKFYLIDLNWIYHSIVSCSSWSTLTTVVADRTVLSQWALQTYIPTCEDDRCSWGHRLWHDYMHNYQERCSIPTVLDCNNFPIVSIMANGRKVTNEGQEVANEGAEGSPCISNPPTLLTSSNKPSHNKQPSCVYICQTNHMVEN